MINFGFVLTSQTPSHFPNDEEIAMQNREFYEKAGGSGFDYIPALNDSEAHIQLLKELFREKCHDWV